MWIRSLPFLGALCVAIAGLSVDVMEIDAAQYAELSRQMLETGRFLQLGSYGTDYLDKPPLVFWSAALSYALFGVSTAAYKLPALCFTALGVWATWGLARRLYSRQAAYHSALLLASCQGAFVMVLDSRTDALLMGCVVTALWQWTEFVYERRLSHLVWGSAAAALAMLAKGPVGLAIPVLALGVHFALRRDWSPLRRPEWVLVPPIVGLGLAPMLYGLHAQFGWAGLEFFFWTQSFGRLTGASPWRDDSTPFYFVSTIAWAFLPWTFALGLALFDRGRTLVRQRFRLGDAQEFITAGAFAVGFVGLSLVRYKLSHYIYVVLPFAALVTGPYLASALARPLPRLDIVRLQGLVCAGLFAAIGVLAGFLFGPPSLAATAAVLVGAALCAWLLRPARSALERAILAPAVAMIGINFAINVHVAPTLLSYQAPSRIGKRLPELGVRPERLVTYRMRPHALGFYAREQVEAIASPAELGARIGAEPLWVYTDARGVRELREAGLAVERELAFDHFPVSRPNPRFLLPGTRASRLERRYLLTLSPAAPGPAAPD